MLALVCAAAHGLTLRTATSLPAPYTPARVANFLATPARWPEIVLSSHSVEASGAIESPLGVGDSVDEIFGAPPLLPLAVRWTCTTFDVGDDGGTLAFESPAGLAVGGLGVAEACSMRFTLERGAGGGCDLELAMGFAPVSPIARLAAPVLVADNALALKVLLPRALRRASVGDPAGGG